MLGSAHEADDAVQETWLRLHRTDGIDNLGGWLTTVVSRVCLDMLRSRTSRREDELAEDVAYDATVGGSSEGDPEFEAELADSVGSALLVVLQSLAPAERLAFVLHDLFAVPFDDIATIIGRSPAATRQLASRARRRVQQPDAPPGHGRPRRSSTRSSRPPATATSRACSRCSTRVPSSAPTPPPCRWAPRRWSPAPAAWPRRSSAGPGRRSRRSSTAAPGAAWQLHGETKVAFGFTVVDGLITEIELLADPDVLGPQRVQLV